MGLLTKMNLLSWVFHGRTDVPVAVERPIRLSHGRSIKSCTNVSLKFENQYHRTDFGPSWNSHHGTGVPRNTQLSWNTFRKTSIEA